MDGDVVVKFSEEGSVAGASVEAMPDVVSLLFLSAIFVLTMNEMQNIHTAATRIDDI